MYLSSSHDGRAADLNPGAGGEGGPEASTAGPVYVSSLHPEAVTSPALNGSDTSLGVTSSLSNNTTATISSLNVNGNLIRGYFFCHGFPC